MKKLSVVLLAILFVFVFAVQAVADVEEVDESAFAGDEVIDFNGLSSGESIDSFAGGFFSNAVYAEDYLISGFWDASELPAVSNFNKLGGISQTPVGSITLNFDTPVTRVGFDALAPSAYPADVDEITVVVYRDGFAVDSFVHDTEYDSTSGKHLKPFIGIQDSAGIEKVEVIGSGSWLLVQNLVVIDNLRFGISDTSSGPITVTINVKPPNCLDARIPINAKSKGVTPVVIVGQADLDGTMIDPDSIELNGVAPVRSAIGDVPYCNNIEPDGVWDLILKFNTHDLVEAMDVSQADKEAIENGEWPSKSLELTGNLFEESGATAIEGSDSVTLVGKLKRAKANNGKGSHQGHDRGHHHGWHKSHGQHKHKGWDKD